MDELVKHDLGDNITKNNDAVLSKLISSVVEQEVQNQIKKMDLVSKAEVVNVVATKVANFPEVQKVSGHVTVLEKVTAAIANFPLIQKVTGTVEAIVKFPAVQKVTGTVEAIVKFPAVQKVTGTVEALVKFPAIQKVDGNVKIDNLPTGSGYEPDARNANPTKYVPVRLTNGKQFYEVWENIGKGVANSRVSRLGVPPHDYISMLYPDATTEQFFYRVGGASGEVVAIVTVGYTDSNKTSISYVQKV